MPSLLSSPLRLLPQGLRSLCVRGGGGRLWNTLAAGPSTHPYLLGLHPPQPAPTQLIAVMLGHCLGDSLIRYLCDSTDSVPRCDPILAHDLLCRGLSVQPVAAILSAVRVLPKMRRVACLHVAHDFCGVFTPSVLFCAPCVGRMPLFMRLSVTSRPAPPFSTFIRSWPAVISPLLPGISLLYMPPLGLTYTSVGSLVTPCPI